MLRAPEVWLGRTSMHVDNIYIVIDDIPWLMYRLIKFQMDKRACELNKSHIISTDEDPGLRIESFAVINLRGVSKNNSIIYVLSPCKPTKK
jgi:hypothetical protein